MNDQTKGKSVKMEVMQAHTRTLFNKGIGNKGTCSTAGATAAKEVTLGSTFSLVTGAQLLVKFTNGISVANATLAVTHTPLGASQAVVETAKPIYLNGAALEAGVIPAGGIVILEYNGTQYEIVGGAGEGGSDAAYVSDTEESAAAPGFDPMLDTVHVTAQQLSSSQKAQARTNIDVYSKGEIDAMRAPSYDPTTKLIVFPATAAFSYDSETKIITLGV